MFLLACIIFSKGRISFRKLVLCLLFNYYIRFRFQTVKKMENADDNLSYAKKKIELARLDQSEILPGIQSLTVDEEQEDFYLLELNTDLMQHVAEGTTLTIRGHPNDSAVICTDSKTYELKEAETSNSLLLLPNMSWPEECEEGEIRDIPQKICGIYHNYFELRDFKPNFKKLRAVLEVNAYKGKEYEDVEAKNYTFEELLDFIQASKEELKTALDTLHTFVINGYIRMLDFKYKFSVLNQVVDSIESKSFPLNKIPKNAVVEILEDLIPREITEACFLWFAHETDEVDQNEQQLFALDEISICRMYAEFLLRSADKFILSEFLKTWQRSVPEGLTCDLVQLRGMALIDKNYNPEIIIHFPHDEMPENISDRFTKLFKVKEKWTYEEIVPYLEELSFAGTDVKSLLIKYTRESTKDGIKLYSSKW